MSPVWMEEEVYDKNIKEEIKKRKAGKTDLQLGKNGITEAFMREVKRRLEKHGVVKVRILRSMARTGGMERRSIAEEVAFRAGARLIEVRGNTFIIAKDLKRKNNIIVSNSLSKERKRGRKWLRR